MQIEGSEMQVTETSNKVDNSGERWIVKHRATVVWMKRERKIQFFILEAEARTWWLTGWWDVRWEKNSRMIYSQVIFILYDYHLQQDNGNSYLISHLHSSEYVKWTGVKIQLMLEPGNQRKYKNIFWNNIKKPTIVILYSLSLLSLLIFSLFWFLFLTLVSLLKYNSPLRLYPLLDITWSCSSSLPTVLKKVVYTDCFLRSSIHYNLNSELLFIFIASIYSVFSGSASANFTRILSLNVHTTQKGKYY